MKFLLLSTMVVALFSACSNNTAVKERSGNGTSVDTVVPQTPPIPIITQPHPASKSKDTADYNPEPSLSSIYNDYVAGYQKSLVIDSVFKMENDTFHLHLKHYCLMDSAVTLPGKYVEMYKLDSFVTHNFVTDLKLEKNNHTLLRMTIRKKDFDPRLYTALRDYGVLYAPSLAIVKGNIQLDYSISIPLTDVGVGVTAVIHQNGDILFNGR